MPISDLFFVSLENVQVVAQLRILDAMFWCCHVIGKWASARNLLELELGFDSTLHS